MTDKVQDDAKTAKVLEEDPAKRAQLRSDRMKAARRAKLDALFGDGRKYVIKKRVTDSEEKFSTPMGNKGRNGFVVQQVSGPRVEFDWADEVTKRYSGDMVMFIVGRDLLKQAHEDYDAIPLPEKPKRRPRAPKA